VEHADKYSKSHRKKKNTARKIVGKKKKITFKKRDLAATMVPSGMLTSSTKRAKSSG
jgi:hypothetical protein